MGLGFSHVLRFGSNLVMTRLLAPEMFGIVAIATVVMVGLTMFSDVGLRQYLVQSKRSESAALLNTAWSVQIVRGALIWILAIAVSLLVAAANRAGIVPASSAYADPILPYVIAVLSVNALIAGFESTKLAEASRRLSLHRVIQIDLCSQLIGFAVMFCWVQADRTIWALVAGGLFSALLRAVLSHLALPGTRNCWHWDKAAFHEILNFGKWIFVSSILGFLVINGDRLLLGLFVTPVVLGVYVIAYSMYYAVEQVLSKVMGDISFPALSEVARERPAELGQTYYRLHGVLASFSYFCAGVLMSSGRALIGMLYDPRYAEAGWMLELLALSLLTIPSRLAWQCFLALGKPKLLTHTIVIQLFALFTLTPLGFHQFGLPGALWGVVLSYYSILPAIIYYLAEHRIFNLRRELMVLPVVALGWAVGKGFSMATVY